MTGGGFVYHRLRHTWASRLYNSGMDLTVLQKLGGWLCLATLQVYVQVRKEKIEQQYEQAYERMKLRQQAPTEEIISMEQFLKMEDCDDVMAGQSKRKEILRISPPQSASPFSVKSTASGFTFKPGR